MDIVKNQEVIICTKERRGNGTDSPIRVITEVFDKDGNLIADSDPYYITIDQLLKVVKQGISFEKTSTHQSLSEYFSITKQPRRER